MHSTVKAYYRSLYYEACDLLSIELERRFEKQHVQEVLSIEHTLMMAKFCCEHCNSATLLPLRYIFRTLSFLDGLNLVICWL